ncbi:Lysocardiolipin acyltransferase 1 [Geodia barretti]|uniref:Lysocardiolipin acyltransferase 1 n=1 Tax=Geodia barretti TaxID=519541 RepID=A0AA35XI00_GEOBA|nr:Lysocardiolipin acyltransferase 1 [Geodia barretti]
MRVSVSGVFFFLVLFLVSYNGTLLFVTPLLLLLPVSLSVYRRWVDYILALWYHLGPALLELLYGVRVRVCGDLQQIQGPCLIILNHRTRFDWLFFWSYIIRMGTPPKHKIVLKDALKKIPGIGWGMQACLFIFISRNWSRDKKTLSDNLAYYSSRGYPLQLLFFPEGTNLSKHTQLKSHKFAAENGLQKYDFVLHPRTMGFVHCLREFRKGVTPPNIVNVTVGYVGSIPENESDIVAGRWPREIHFCADTVPHSQIPSGEEELADWLNQCWQNKEEALKQFYREKRFQRPYLDETGSTRIKLALISVLVFWAIFLVLSLYVIASYPWMMLGLSVFYFTVAVLGPGLDWVILQLHQMTYQAKLFSKT